MELPKTDERFGRRLKARASYMNKGHTDNDLREAEEKMSLGLIMMMELGQLGLRDHM